MVMKSDNTGTLVVLWLGTHGEYDERNKKR